MGGRAGAWWLVSAPLMGGVRGVREVSAGAWLVSAALFSGTYSQKERPRSFAEMERTLAKRKNAREASKSSKNTIESRDDVANVNYHVQK
jgi:hypothetical protein